MADLYMEYTLRDFVTWSIIYCMVFFVMYEVVLVPFYFACHR